MFNILPTTKQQEKERVYQLPSKIFNIHTYVRTTKYSKNSVQGNLRRQVSRDRLNI